MGVKLGQSSVSHISLCVIFSFHTSSTTTTTEPAAAMGAVHGVYLKYVGLSAISFAGYQMLVGNAGLLGSDSRILATSSSSDVGERGASSSIIPLLRFGAASILGYSTLLNGTIAVLFKMRRGMSLIGKDLKEGSIPWWSYALFFPFHLPTYGYTWVHTKYGKMKPLAPAPNMTSSDKNAAVSNKQPKIPVPVASEVQPGWWVGGCYAYKLNKQWAAVIDLTVEFPEGCIASTKRYLCLPTWDGVPCSPVQLEQAAQFCIEARENWKQLQQKGEVEGEPHILIHCAHGRGRSTTVACAALVKSGLYSNWEEALEVGIRPGRPVFLDEWIESECNRHQVLPRSIG
ncbi:predicted protein [Thalassiosira pseudonana CCMP1335]|uniref:Tyrosine specific protein phosphatases domain-containing protein n=1 Tax=Thalassiosira pseudonana TaxID=35128 RepID=B8C0L2_THAPS|nr:predicted protein [Thalassiosira pseudonana CCMP1335]EED93537.1 predicted protein [Thalassiosira pseudonana CCMP1335]